MTDTPEWTFATAIAQIESCEFHCVAGPLTNNVAWQWLRKALADAPSVEQVARAIHAVSVDVLRPALGFEPTPFDELNPTERKLQFDYARAALASLRAAPAGEGEEDIIELIGEAEQLFEEATTRQCTCGYDETNCRFCSTWIKASAKLRKVKQWLRAAIAAACPEGWVCVPRDLDAAGPGAEKAHMIGEFFEEFGEGLHQQRVAVSWTTIKDIRKRLLDFYAAPPSSSPSPAGPDWKPYVGPRIDHVTDELIPTGEGASAGEEKYPLKLDSVGLEGARRRGDARLASLLAGTGRAAPAASGDVEQAWRDYAQHASRRTSFENFKAGYDAALRSDVPDPVCGSRCMSEDIMSAKASNELERANIQIAALTRALAEERERCAKVADEVEPEHMCAVDLEIARRIRALPPPDLSSSCPRCETMRKALDDFVDREHGIMADVVTAHNNRGDGASQWMREDDMEFRQALRRCFAAARAALQEQQD